MPSWFGFTPAEYIRVGGWRGLPGEWPREKAALEPWATVVQGEGPWIVSRDGPMWSLECMFDADGSMTADQLVIAPELAGLDPETDDEVIRAALPFAYVDAVEAADAVADVPIEAIYGGSPLDDESVVFLANGVNLHCQPAGARAVLRLITNDQTEAARRFVRAVHARRR